MTSLQTCWRLGYCPAGPAVLLLALSTRRPASRPMPRPRRPPRVGGYYTCSMHPQIHEDAPGKCPICGMDLIAVKTGPVAKKAATSAAVYTCPMHPQVHQTKPGLCPICGMDLVKHGPGNQSRPGSAAAG